MRLWQCKPTQNERPKRRPQPRESGSAWSNATPTRMEGSTMSRKRMIACTLFLLYACSLVASGQEETKVKGMISSRNGDQMTIRTRDGERTVLLTDDTKAQVPSGMFRHKETSMAELIPGLAVEVQGRQDGDSLIAKM